ncbi:MAG TPA: DHA2 family efflux MFS transporter permease subunit [Dehalococcoidia bacterium]|nr:DHA2 family efflux MFS transporter permease subunit [Dehalococcoidia bacterium]HIK89836.1 DHA2 family efflux MFS transporter permease subunit [Dehalococcoidia bacterium]
MAESKAGPFQEEWKDHGLTPRQIKLTLIGVMFAMFLASLDQTIVATAIPRIMADLDGFDRFTWISTAYIVASTSVVLITGAVSDVYGRKWLFVGAIMIFLVGSVLAASSPTMNALIIFRAVQGLGGGMIMALSFVTIADLFPPQERAKYMGIIAAMFGVSSVIGPTLGGFITDQLSWHWIFLVNIPAGIPIIFLFIKFFPNAKKDGPTRKIDVGGAVLIVLAIVPGLLGLSWGGNQYEWSDPLVVGSLVFSGAMLVVFALYETRVADPLLPLAVFKNRVVGIALFVTLLTGFAMFGAIFFVPLLFQGVLGASPTASGSFLTPMMLGIVFGAAMSGQLLSRTGGHYRIQGIIAVSIMAIGIFFLSQVSSSTTHAYALTSAIAMGFGLGISFPVYTIAIQNGVPQQYLGIATSSAQFFRSVGGSIGLALFGSYMVRQFKDGMQENLPDAALEAVPPQLLDTITSNPNALLNPEASESLMSAFAASGESGAALGVQVFDAIRESLAGAIGDVFFLAFMFVVAAVIATAFIREVPLRKRGGPPGKAAGEALADSAATPTDPG